MLAISATFALFARRTRRSPSQALAAMAALLTAGAWANVAQANPRALPFTYPYATLPEGEAEIEQYADLTPLTALSASSSARTWYLAPQFQTEFEYGITDRLELGLYVTFAPSHADTLTSTAALTEGDGVKQRLRLRLAEQGAWPVDVALYGEVVENDREIELEAKVILGKRLGRLDLMANLVAEREYYFVNRRDWVIDPSAGFTYEVTPTFHPGLEGWMRAEFTDPKPAVKPFDLDPHFYVGPTALFNFGRIWWSTGVYVRLDDFARSLQPGDAFGNVWVRTIIGVSL